MDAHIVKNIDNKNAVDFKVVVEANDYNDNYCISFYRKGKELYGWKHDKVLNSIKDELLFDWINQAQELAREWAEIRED